MDYMPPCAWPLGSFTDPHPVADTCSECAHPNGEHVVDDTGRRFCGVFDHRVGRLYCQCGAATRAAHTVMPNVSGSVDLGDGTITQGPFAGERLTGVSLTIERRWVRVADRLPEPGVEVLACTAAGSIYVADVMNGRLGVDDCSHATLTHWMPLPEPPEE